LRARGLERDLASAESALAQAALSYDDHQRRVTPEQQRDLLHDAVAQASAVLTRDTGYARAWFVRAKAYHRLQSYADALLDLDRAEQLGGVSANILHYRIDTLRQLGGPQAQARLRRDLVALLDLDGSPHAWSMVVDHLLDLAAHAEPASERDVLLVLAERMLDRASGDQANPRVAVARAHVRELRGDRAGALAAMRRACAEHRIDATVQAEAAQLFARLGQAGDASAAAAAAAALDPTREGAPPESEPGERPAPAIARDEVRSFLESLEVLLDTIEPAGSLPSGRR
jgi:tetratricopeptide (TPR) repeat protein